MTETLLLKNKSIEKRYTTIHTNWNGMLGHMLSGWLKQPLIFFNNQESIVPQGCFGTPHF